MIFMSINARSFTRVMGPALKFSGHWLWFSRTWIQLSRWKSIPGKWKKLIFALIFLEFHLRTDFFDAGIPRIITSSRNLMSSSPISELLDIFAFSETGEVTDIWGSEDKLSDSEDLEYQKIHNIVKWLYCT